MVGPSLLQFWGEPGGAAEEFSRLSRLQQAGQVVLAHGADYLHLEVMDGAFAAGSTFDAGSLRAMRASFPNVLFDIHLMVEQPVDWILRVAEANRGHLAKTVFTFHYESLSDHRSADLIQATLRAVRRAGGRRGMRAGLAFHPGTPAPEMEAVVRQFRDQLFLVLVMSVVPGAAEQSFETHAVATLEKIARLRRLFPDLTIEVDGGLKPDENTTGRCLGAGANMIVSGTGIFGAVRLDDLSSRPIDQIRSAIIAANIREIKTMRPVLETKVSNEEFDGSYLDYLQE
jgi:ribulose-phosphate 3-epimerase